VLEELLVSAGLEPEAAGEVPTLFEFADLEAAWRSVAAAGPGTRRPAPARPPRALVLRAGCLTATVSMAPSRGARRFSR
jgi:hypothetical protein